MPFEEGGVIMVPEPLVAVPLGAGLVIVMPVLEPVLVPVPLVPVPVWVVLVPVLPVPLPLLVLLDPELAAAPLLFADEPAEVLPLPPVEPGVPVELVEPVLPPPPVPSPQPPLVVDGGLLHPTSARPTAHVNFATTAGAPGLDIRIMISPPSLRKLIARPPLPMVSPVRPSSSFGVRV
jgi:hypothetical protein